jgi:hypothetical protein
MDLPLRGPSKAIVAVLPGAWTFHPTSLGSWSLTERGSSQSLWMKAVLSWKDSKEYFSLTAFIYFFFLYPLFITLIF